jgi:hypothetical protein
MFRGLLITCTYRPLRASFYAVEATAIKKGAAAFKVAASRLMAIRR